MILCQFGQNKIQYKDFGYKILSTEHFDIYFYQGGDEIAKFAEDVLEEGYEKLNGDLGITVDFRIPVILYNSPNDFSQTNVTLDLIEESVGGFTEILKNRMVIPFTGDYAELRHVLVHELTHVFEFVIFFPSKLEAMLSGDLFYSIPLWVMEGYAEYISLEWDVNTDIFVRDLVTNNKTIPLAALGNYGGYLIYKEGQAFYHYVAEKYGRKKTAEFIHLLKAKKNLDATFLELFGVSVEDFNDRWLRYYQLQYWPRIGLQENFESAVRVVYDHRKTNSLYNTSPAISPKGDKIAFISDRSGTAEIIVISSIDGHILKRLVRSEYASGYEGLHLYQGGLTWSPDEKYIAFAAKTRGEDALYVINSRSGKVAKRFHLKLDGIFSPVYAPDGNTIYFSGLKDSYLDIYKLDLASGRLDMVTDDIYTDKYPNVTGDGTLLFVSDRPDSNEKYHYGSYSVFIAAADGFQRVVPRTDYVASPFAGPDHGIYFVADYDSAYNLYYYSDSERRITKRTDVLTGFYYPSISEAGDKIALGYYNNYGYDIGVAKDLLAQMVDYQGTEGSAPGDAYVSTELDPKSVKNYRTRFTFDYMVAAASYTTPLFFAGMVQVGVSDILGNHQFQLSTNFNGSLEGSDIFLNYWYLAKRPDFGAGFFQYLNYFSEGNDLLIWRYLGLSAAVQYPLDRFLRLEFGLYGYKVYETRWFGFFPDYYSEQYRNATYNFLYPDLAVVFDNAQWGEIGPVNGRRVRLEGYKTVFSDMNILSAMLDYRRYLKLSPRASLAGRLVAAGSFGPDKEYWTIGGGYSLRGYDYYEFTGSKLGFLNLEYRFPFIDRLKISFPIPLEIRNVRGAIFADLGAVAKDSFRLYEPTDGWFRFKDVHMGLGGGIRFEFLYTIFRLDWARAHDFQQWTGPWKFYLSIGQEW
jgi:hypothetical protein